MLYQHKCLQKWLMSHMAVCIFPFGVCVSFICFARHVSECQLYRRREVPFQWQPIEVWGQSQVRLQVMPSASSRARPSKMEREKKKNCRCSWGRAPVRKSAAESRFVQCPVFSIRISWKCTPGSVCYSTDHDTLRSHSCHKQQKNDF